MSELYDSPFSEGTLVETCERMADVITPVDERAKEYLMQAEEVAYMEEPYAPHPIVGLIPYGAQ